MQTAKWIWGHFHAVNDYFDKIRSFPSSSLHMSSPLPVMPFHLTLTPHNPHSALLLGLNIFKGIKVQKTACLISNSPWDCRFDLRALKRWRELRRESEQGGREMDKDIRCWKNKIWNQCTSCKQPLAPTWNTRLIRIQSWKCTWLKTPQNKRKSIFTHAGLKEEKSTFLVPKSMRVHSSGPITG